MTVGEGIFYSALFLGLVGLFVATKDRWNWKKIVVRTLLGVVTLAILLGGGLYAYIYLEDRPKPLVAQTEFWGVSISETKSDVKFKKGEPPRILDPGEEETWAWEPAGTPPKKPDDKTVAWNSYLVDFRANQIATIDYVGKKSYESPELLGVRVGDTLEEVTKKLGMPTQTTQSSDDLLRRISYAKYNVYFTLEQNSVVQMGIYNPTFPAPSYSKDKKPKDQPKNTPK